MRNKDYKSYSEKVVNLPQNVAQIERADNDLNCKYCPYCDHEKKECRCFTKDNCAECEGCHESI